MQKEDFWMIFQYVQKSFFHWLKLVKFYFLLTPAEAQRSLTKIEKVTKFTTKLLFTLYSINVYKCYISQINWGYIFRNTISPAKFYLKKWTVLSCFFSFLQSIPSVQFVEQSNHSKIAEGKMSSTSQSPGSSNAVSLVTLTLFPCPELFNIFVICSMF